MTADPLLQACLNGARWPHEHPRLPVSPAQLATDAASAAAAGAQALHLHPKDGRGADTLEDPPLRASLAAVRSAAPGLPVSVTTGAWAMSDPADRVRAVHGWTVLPDVASVNWHEPGAEQVAAALLERGVGVEAGLWHEQAAHAWLDWPARGRCSRVLLELPDGLDEWATQELAGRLVELVAQAPVPVLLHGEGTSCWPALRSAGRRGLQTRIGLEDVLTLPDGSSAGDNAALIRAACGELAALGWRPATR